MSSKKLGAWIDRDSVVRTDQIVRRTFKSLLRYPPQTVKKLNKRRPLNDQDFHNSFVNVLRSLYAEGNFFHF